MPKQFAPFAILSILLMNTSVQAQVRDASPERTLWDHNGSVMYLIANGSSREFFYEKPRPGMVEAGAKKALSYSVAKSTTDNTPARRTYLTLGAGSCRFKSRETFSKTANGLC